MYPEDVFRSNFMISKYQKFPLVLFNDLIVYFNSLEFPEEKTHPLVGFGVWKAVHLCVQVLVFAKHEANLFLCKS